MIKKTLILVLGIFCLINASAVLATTCDPKLPDTCETTNGKGFFCLPDPTNAKDPTGSTIYICQEDQFKATFGNIQAPDALKGFISKDPTGSFGISQFLSNIVALFYTVAAVVLIFMLLWGAFDWMTSEGDKEKINSARNKIISAVMGMLLFAVTFAVIQVVGHFTGFTFFTGQNP